MAITDYNVSASLNTLLGAIGVGEGMDRNKLNDAIRQLMADIAVLPTSAGAALIGHSSGETVEDAIAGTNNAIVPARMAYVEQFIQGMFGRGMIANEAASITTQQNITVSAAAGATTITVADVTKFDVGGGCVVAYDDGTYGPHFIEAVGADTLAIRPGLRSAVTSGAQVERLWYNQAHAGKYYMRYLAQRIARGTELESAAPSSDRILFTLFDTTDPEDTLSDYGSAAVSYFTNNNLGESADVTTPVRFSGRSAYVDYSVDADGVETPLFTVKRPCRAIVRVNFMARLATSTFAIRVVDESSNVLAEYTIPANGQNVLQTYNVPFHTKKASRLKVQVEATDAASASYFVLNMIDVFDAPETTGPVIAKKNAVIVGLGDSWMAGDIITTAEREPITQQLALELPFATIINAGVGGNDVYALFDRFDTDVTPYNPDYVIIETGTNDAYSPSSGTFDPNAIENFRNKFAALINKVLAIGARPIVLGVPALAESDTAANPSFTSFLLNDRARSYDRTFKEYMAVNPNLPSTITAATGTALTGAYATFAGQNVSVAYVEAEAQATDDAVKAASQRIKALEDAIRAAGIVV
jgi:lysophospholipase L1-like esterase